MLWIEVLGGVAGAVVLLAVTALMALSMLPSPTTRELLKRWERRRKRSRRSARSGSG